MKPSFINNDHPLNTCMVQAKTVERSIELFRAGLADGCDAFGFQYEKLEKELHTEDNKAYITFEKGEYAVMSTMGRRVSKKLAENPDGENTVEFEFLDTDGYIRFDVVDKYGKRANTCAYFLGDLK